MKLKLILLCCIFFAHPVYAQQNADSPDLGERNTDTAYKNGEHLFGVHAAIGFPQVTGYGLNYFSPDRSWGLAASMGGFSLKRDKSGSDPEIKLRYNGMHLSGRYHPYHGVFYFGLHAGLHTANIEATDTYNGVEATTKGTLKGNYAAPHVGWLWLTRAGVHISTEIGAQFGFGAKIDIEDGTTEPLVLADSTYRKNRQDAEDEGKKLFNSTLPYLTLIRVGYSF